MALASRKLRYSTDIMYETGLSDVPMLGMLPQITGGVREPRELAAAGYAIHHLRVLLANRMNKWRRRTLVVTSPVDGCGQDEHRGGSGVVVCCGASQDAFGSTAILCIAA